MKTEQKDLKFFQKKLKEVDIVAYKTMAKKMKNPLELVNELIRHYQWILKHGDLDKLNLQDNNNRIYQDLFIYAMTSSKDFSDEFYNYFINCVKIAYNKKTRRWNFRLVNEIIVNSKRLYHFDVAAMYILIATTLGELQEYINNININKIIHITHTHVIELFEGIVSQRFYNELKKKIINKRVLINEYDYN